MQSNFPKFQANRLFLRAGRKVIWEDANWELSGHVLIAGGNGTGKSTTLKLLAGQWAPTRGTLTLSIGRESVPPDNWMSRIGLAAPWCSMPTQLTLKEALEFHQTFHRPRPGDQSWGQMLKESDLNVDASAPIKHWSSGQRQRLHLALAMGSACPVVLLDEPTANLDAHGIEWYQEALRRILNESTVIVASNSPKNDALEGASLLEI